MKTIFHTSLFFGVLLCCAFLLGGCGGTYSIASGVSDTAAISFTANKKLPVRVIVDGNEHNVDAVKTKAYRTDRKIKKTAKNTINIEPGQHDVQVYVNGNEVYNKKLFVSPSEHRIVNL